MTDDFEKRELIGSLRTITRILHTSEERMQELWENKEMMMTPGQTKEIDMLIKTCKKSLSAINKTAQLFQGVSTKRES